MRTAELGWYFRIKQVGGAVDDRSEREEMSARGAEAGSSGLLAGGMFGVLLGVGIGAAIGLFLGMLVGRARGEAQGLTKGIEIGRLEAASAVPPPRRWRRLWRRGDG